MSFLTIYINCPKHKPSPNFLITDLFFFPFARDLGWQVTFSTLAVHLCSTTPNNLIGIPNKIAGKLLKSSCQLAQKLSF